VDLPYGTAINPGSGDGLDACTSEQIGLLTSDPVRFKAGPDSCPDASQIGKLVIKTPALVEDFTGEVFLAKPFDNPFNSQFAIYLVAHSEERGIIVKLAGKLEVDEGGQIRSVFDDLPQLPFSSLELQFKGGARGTLANPQACGEHEVTTVMTPVSGNSPASASNTFVLDDGPQEKPCSFTLQDRPFDPTFSAGLVSPSAGTYSPFVFRMSREDGEQCESSRPHAAPFPWICSSS